MSLPQSLLRTTYGAGRRKQYGLRRPACLIALAGLLLLPLLLLSPHSHDDNRTARGPAYVSYQTATKLDAAAGAEGAPLTLSSLAAARSELQSGFNCTVAEPENREDYIVCMYTHLALWNGTLYYLSNTGSPLPPPVNVDWMLGAQLTPEPIPSLDVLGLAPDTQVELVERSALLFLAFSHNFYHVFAEYMPSLHNVLCRQWGMCAYDAESDLQILLLNWFNVHEARWEQPMTPDFIRCVTRAAARHVRSPQYDGKLLLLRHAVAGWGAEARADHGHLHHWESVRPVGRPMMELWRRRLADCLSFDVAKAAPSDPVNVVIVDREYGAGRTFLNLRDMQALVAARWPGANLKVAYLEHMNLQESAALFNDMTVVIWQHGAAMANLIFLPHGASGIQVVMKDRPQELYGWPDELLRDYPNTVRLVHATNTDPDNIVMRPGYARWSHEWGQVFDSKQKLQIWESKACPGHEGEHTNHVCEEWWFKLGSSLQVDLRMLAAALDLVMPAYLQPAGSPLQPNGTAAGGSRL